MKKKNQAAKSMSKEIHWNTTHKQQKDTREKTRRQGRGGEKEPEERDTKQMKEHLNSKNAYKIKFNQSAS